MTCIGYGTRGGVWCGTPLLVWVELAPPAFWLNSAMVVDVLFTRCCSRTSGMSPKVGCSKASAMVERIWVGGWFLVEVWGKSSSGWRR
jgi:hypothetical protein